MMQKVNRKLNREVLSQNGTKLIYFSIGCTFFVVIPCFVFKFVEGWSYLDALYFCIISLTKIGFGDYVPNTMPPDKFARYAELRTFLHKFHNGFFKFCSQPIIMFDSSNKPLTKSRKAFLASRL